VPQPPIVNISWDLGVRRLSVVCTMQQYACPRVPGSLTWCQVLGRLPQFAVRIGKQSTAYQVQAHVCIFTRYRRRLCSRCTVNITNARLLHFLPSPYYLFWKTIRCFLVPYLPSLQIDLHSPSRVARDLVTLSGLG
jgi:hypothetical protein